MISRSQQLVCRVLVALCVALVSACDDANQIQFDQVACVVNEGLDEDGAWTVGRSKYAGDRYWWVDVEATKGDLRGDRLRVTVKFLGLAPDTVGQPVDLLEFVIGDIGDSVTVARARVQTYAVGDESGGWKSRNMRGTIEVSRTMHTATKGPLVVRYDLVGEVSGSDHRFEGKVLADWD